MKIKTENLSKFTWFVFFVQWNINLRGLFNAKAIIVEEQYKLSYSSIADARVHIFVKGISPKVNLTA